LHLPGPGINCPHPEYCLPVKLNVPVHTLLIVSNFKTLTIPEYVVVESVTYSFGHSTKELVDPVTDPQIALPIVPVLEVG
jgi:hypothetical protein